MRPSCDFAGQGTAGQREEAWPLISEMIAFIKEHRDNCVVEPICRPLQIAPRPLPGLEFAKQISREGTFCAQLAVENDPAKASDRAKRDAELRAQMKQVREGKRSVYGARKFWHAMRREGHDPAHCPVEQLMRDIGIEGVRRGKNVKTKWPDKTLPCPTDRVNWQFRVRMPDQLRVSDFTCVPSWQGFAYLAFVIDTFANKIVWWRTSGLQHTQFVLFSRKHALHAPAGWWSNAGLEPGVGTVGAQQANALAETMTGLLKAQGVADRDHGHPPRHWNGRR